MKSNGRSQSQRGGIQTHQARDHLKSDRDAMAGSNPAAQRDQFGSRHNADDVKAAQRQHGRPGGRQDLQFRESAQDLAPNRGKIKKAVGSRTRKSGSAGRAARGGK